MEIVRPWYPRLQRSLHGLMRGFCWVSPDPLVAQSCVETYKSYDYHNSHLTPFWLQSLARLPKRSQPELSTHMEAFAESLTRKFRTEALVVEGRKEPGNEWRVTPEVVVGEVWRTTTCFAVDWR